MSPSPDTPRPEVVTGSSRHRFAEGGLGHPLLLTQSGWLAEGVLDELRRLDVGEVVLLGSERAIAPGVATALEEAGHRATRVGGPDRFATAAQVARQRFDAQEVEQVVLVRGAGDAGRGWADAAPERGGTG